MPARRDNLPTRSPQALRAQPAAFSLVEILVVIAIIGILLAVVFKGGRALVENARKRDTEALLKKLDLALDEYKREVDTSRIPFAKNIFNGAPPDNLVAFLGKEVTIGGCPVRMRNTGSFVHNNSSVPDAELNDERNQSTGALQDLSSPFLHGDIRAMVLAIRLNSPKAKAILDSIDPKYWADSEQVGGYEFVPNPDNDNPAARIPLDHLIDGWGVPLEYYSTCRCIPPPAPLAPREEVSNSFVHENNDGGLAVSYGPNGAEQFAQDMMAAEGDTTLVADYYPDHLVNHPFNSDNLYSSDFFTNRVRQTGP